MGLTSSESSELDEEEGRGRRAAAEAEEAMHPRRRSRAVGSAAGRAMVANGGGHRRSPLR